MKLFTSKTQKIGEIGENICVTYLTKLNFRILDRNFTKKIGEIDVIAKKNDIIHFIEVKSIVIKNVPHETYNPAENFTKDKYMKVYKTVKLYLEENNVSREKTWQIDLYCIYIDSKNKRHKLSKIENVVFS